MQRRRLGQSDLEVSILGLGTVKFGRNQGVKYPSAFTLPTDRELIRLLNSASDLGINLLDTAPAYGIAEERLGKLLRGNRSKWVISTKVGESFCEGKSYFDFSKTALILSVERSLQRLQTDYLDVVLVHSNGDDERLIAEEEVFSTLALLKQAGKLRAFGMSSKTVAGGIATLKTADIAMVTFNSLETTERKVIAYAHQHQKSIFIKKALLSGHLQKIKHADPIAHALKFILREPGITSVIVGTLNAKHLQENALCAMQALAN